MSTIPARLRKHDREPSGGKVRVIWRDLPYGQRSVTGEALDHSPSGLRVAMPCPIEIGTHVRVEALGLGVSGFASVRHCDRNGLRYLVGLAFAEHRRGQP